MRLVASALVASALLGALASPAVADVRVAVQACPTTYGVPGDHPIRPTHATLPLKAKEARSLVAWAGGGTPIVLAPHGFACTALVGADGGVHVRIAPPDARPATGPAVDVEVEGSCVGCIASVACGLFPAQPGTRGSRATRRTRKPSASRACCRTCAPSSTPRECTARATHRAAV